jgi:ABC-2 type transport system permease protein
MRYFSGVYTIWYRDILRFWYDKTRMVGSMLFPIFFLFVFGSGLSGRIGLFAPGIDFTRFIFPGIIGMTVLMGSFMGGVSVVWDREFGFLKEVLVAPVSRASVAIGKTLGSATVAMVQGIVMLIFAPIIGVSLTPIMILVLLPLTFLLAAAMGSMGILLATRVQSMQAFQLLTQMLTFPMIFLSGVFFPPEGLPAWMNALVKINPATYGVAIIRQVLLGDNPEATFSVSLFGHAMSLWDNILVLAAFGLVMVILAVWSFGHQD